MPSQYPPTARTAIGLTCHRWTGSVSSYANHSFWKKKEQFSDVDIGKFAIEYVVVEGNTVNLKSGKDTNLIGAVVKGTTVNADIGGNLRIESPQDTSVYNETSQNSGGTLSISAAGVPGGSVTRGSTKIDSNFQSVGQQSAIRAGDGGFNVNVQGKTDLIGGQITSTQKAVDDNKNSFETKGPLTTTNLANAATYSATGSSVTVGIGSELASSGAGAGRATGNANSTTEAAITGVAGNKTARTGDFEAGLQPIFNLEAVKLDVATQIEITKKFGQNASKAVGDFAGGKLDDAKKKQEEADNADKAGNSALASQLRAEATELDAVWGEGKPGRVALHAIVGGLGGGVGGAVGAVTSQTVVPLLAAEINKLDIPKELKEGLILAAGAAVGAATGGVTGLAAAVNATGQNFLSHTEAKQLQKNMAACKAKPRGCADQDERSIRDKYIALSNDNISKVEKMIIAGDVVGVATLEGQAANSSEVNGAFSTRQDEQIFTERQNNIKVYGSIKGAYSLFGTDVQQAQDVAIFRRDNCQTISPAACTTLTLEAMADRMKRVGVLMAVGSLTPLAVNGARRLTVPGKTAQSNLTAAQLAEIEKSPFVTKGVPFTDEMIQTNPAVKSMFEDFKRALGGDSKRAAEFTERAIESGSNLPTLKQVGPNDPFVKLVPVGGEAGKSSFYVSKAQYDLFVSKGMDAAQIADALGLPAQSFASGGAVGFQAYVIQPKPGQLATVYQSTVAPVQQGGYTGQGGATQYIVPELGKFTDPKPIGAVVSPASFVQPIAPSISTVIAPAILPNNQKKKVTQ
jgi:Hemagglutinin repeat